MSAFMVSTTHIRALVSACVSLDRHDQCPQPDWTALHARHPDAFAECVTRNEHGVTILRSTQAGRGWRNWCENELGRALVLANLDSLQARYPGDGEGGLRHPDLLGGYTVAELLSFRNALVERPVVELVKAVHCFAYQACEVSNWETCWAKRFCDELESVLVRNLPGYDAAPWGFNDPENGAPEPGAAGAPVSILSLMKGAR